MNEGEMGYLEIKDTGLGAIRSRGRGGNNVLIIIAYQ